MLTTKERIQQAASTCRVALSVNFEAQLEALAIIEIDEGGDPLGYSVVGNIGHLQIRGLLAPNVGMDLIEYGLTGYDVLVDYIGRADADDAVEELWLDVDSDGGFADGIGSVVAALENFSKPIRTFVTGNMNSAAYHIGCAGSPIAATNELALIGSIGAYSVHTEYSAMLAKDGIVKKLFRSGRWKGAFNAFTPLTETEEQRLQQEVDEVAGRFFNTVANYRQLTIDEIKAFDGDHFRANEALTKKLIDEIGEMQMPGEATPPVTTSETAPVTPPVAASFTQADIDAAVAKAAADATAAAEAKSARRADIMAHDKGSAALKTIYADDAAFADLSVDKVKAALDASVMTGEETLENMGGAGVQADRTDPPSTTKTAEQLAADKGVTTEKALETIKNSKVKVL